MLTRWSNSAMNPSEKTEMIEVDKLDASSRIVFHLVDSW